MRKYFPFAIIIALYAFTLVAIGWLLQPQQLSTVQDSIEQDVAGWDALIDSISLDSNGIPSFDSPHWAFAVFDGQSIVYSTAELNNTSINDSSFASNQWMIKPTSFGLYLQKYVPKGDLNLLVEINLRDEWPNVWSDQGGLTTDNTYSQMGDAIGAIFLLSSRKIQAVQSTICRLGDQKDAPVVYVSRYKGYFSPNALLVTLGVSGGLFLYLLF